MTHLPRVDAGLTRSHLSPQRETYEDGDGARKEEIAALGGGNNVFRHGTSRARFAASAHAARCSAFYERMKELRDAHRHFPNALAATQAERDEGLLVEPHVDFTGEEGSAGRFLDLQEHFRTFINAPFGRQLDYSAYLAQLSEAGLRALARPLKFGAAYAQYRSALSEYLLDFQRRAAPLAYPDPHLRAREAAFEAAWAEGRCAGWEDRGCGAADAQAEAAPQLDAFDTAEEMCSALGEDGVKATLAALGMKSGGTPAQRAERLWAAKGRRLAQLDVKLFVRGAAPVTDAAERARAEAAAKRVAALESRVLALLELLAEQLQATRGNVEKKSTLSYAELEAERMEEEEDWPEEAEEGDAATIYNPLKLPMGWDGKPIPYWLFKLHGLNQEFKCEICGNFSYWGRRAYERHFREARHQHGMRCLKVPNSRAFLEVTSISDALQLHKAMSDKGAAAFRTDADEEFEDAAGNVYNRKTYMDLSTRPCARRQRHALADISLIQVAKACSRSKSIDLALVDLVHALGPYKPVIKRGPST